LRGLTGDREDASPCNEMHPHAMDCHWLGRFSMKPRPLRIDPDRLYRAGRSSRGGAEALAERRPISLKASSVTACGRLNHGKGRPAPWIAVPPSEPVELRRDSAAPRSSIQRSRTHGPHTRLGSPGPCIPGCDRLFIRDPHSAADLESGIYRGDLIKAILHEQPRELRVLEPAEAIDH
jgi:hypothetical protein